VTSGLALILGCGSRELAVRGPGSDDAGAAPPALDGSVDEGRPAVDAVSDGAVPSPDAALDASHAVIGALLPNTHLLAVSDRDIFELDRDGAVLRRRRAGLAPRS
jgi:hypothetical protein